MSAAVWFIGYAVVIVAPWVYGVHAALSKLIDHFEARAIARAEGRVSP